ncbi:hypothetical protein BT96DRAFT_820748 [Gymnopus androsaceus JB14]|uniref:MARVEL domain-containing protein n=1 Tax=Gymnopus androsaceus JB14 TaxID=1447944 RepID=A0A6A4HMH1_9AGAR|nr:hypothetical protein BT96DRAFT_820748 [Gymnopus androsaceus JB14]
MSIPVLQTEKTQPESNKALSIICSAVIASVSVWNLGFAQGPPSLEQVIQVDSYVIFVGGAGLVLVFAIIFVEVGRNRNASITSRVWFECLWSGLLFVLNISAASLVTALIPSQMCQSHLPILACTSTKVLQGFTWLFSIIIFAYFLIIFVTVFIRSGSDSRMWHGSVYNISFYDQGSSTRLQSPEPPTSPTPSRMLGRFKAPSIVAPRPQRPAMPYAYRSGLSPDYQIEHFQFPGPQPQRPPPAHAATSADQSNLSFYPDFLRSSLRSSLTPNVTQVAPTSILNFNSSAVPSDSPQGAAVQRTSPPPLRDWPRADIMTLSPQALPKRSSRWTTKISSTSPSTVPVQQPEPAPLASQVATVTETRNISGPITVVSRSSRPTGPRTRTRGGSTSEGNTSANANRPPPLDLTGISALKPNR